MKITKTITLRLDEDEYEKLVRFAKKQKLSINNIVKKAIQLNFNFKTQDVVKTTSFLIDDFTVKKDTSMVEKTILYASIESLAILREIAKKEGDDLGRVAKEIAKQKVSELTE
jgi:hypothetical protein